MVAAIFRLTAASLVLQAGAAMAADLRDAEAVPHLPPAGRTDYLQFLGGEAHRAFALAPGGTWGWKAGAATPQAAGDAALEACRAHTAQKCVLYALDHRVVFDAKAWTALWGPYKSKVEARRAPVGTRLGERLPDLAFTDPAGKRTSLAALRGRVVVLHFWGSWCGPCRKEMPDVEKLHTVLAGRKDVVFVLLQVRETLEVSRRWAQAQGIRLPLSDSGATGEDDALFRLASGGTLPDRDVAARFPTTYVLDRHGLVVFSHVGAVSRWPRRPALGPLGRKTPARTTGCQ
jgi:thiol-disulfide isomerase/thioredoxin